MGSSPHLLEKEMAPHSSTLAWKIPRTEERSRLQSMGSQRVRHYWATSLTSSIKGGMKMKPRISEKQALRICCRSYDRMWRRKWQPTAVFLPGESQGQGSQAGYSPWHCKRVRRDGACMHAVEWKEETARGVWTLGWDRPQPSPLSSCQRPQRRDSALTQIMFL